MIDALFIAATGMKAEQTQIDNISNNLANINTNAYKKSRVGFEDLMYRDMTAETSMIDRMSGQMVAGLGTSVSAVTRDFQAGDLKATQNPLDVAIDGAGFLEVTLENGEYAYTRNGALKINQDGFLTTIDGKLLSGNIQVPSDATALKILQNGAVQANIGTEEVDVGQLELASFTNVDNLRPIGEGLFAPTEQSGPALYSEPGTNGTGATMQGFLEASNVNLVEEMLSLVVAQRAYEVNSQIVRASDEIMQINNNLRS